MDLEALNQLYEDTQKTPRAINAVGDWQQAIYQCWPEIFELLKKAQNRAL